MLHIVLDILPNIDEYALPPVPGEELLYSYCRASHNGYNLNQKGGSMAKDKSPKKEEKKPKKKK